MSLFDYRTTNEFIPTGTGECSNCRSQNVEVCTIPEDTALCRHCWENETTVCGVCGQMWLSDAIEFFYDEDSDTLVCQYCHEEQE